jgi:hypothetical protein
MRLVTETVSFRENMVKMSLLCRNFSSKNDETVYRVPPALRRVPTRPKLRTSTE